MRNRVLALVLTVLGLATAACQEGQEMLGVAEAESMMAEAFPDADVSILGVEPAAERLRAAARLNDGDVFVLFAPVDGGGWRIDGIEQGDVEYSVADLRGIADTVNRMSVVSDALQSFREATGEFPALPDISGLRALVSEYAAEDSLRDAWDRPFRYLRQGTEYTMTSDGPDGEAHTPDDLIVVTGRFVQQAP